MRHIISFLLGSGFSIPEGLPGVNQLNDRLSKINEEEILIHTDQTAIFLDGQEDPNRWSRWDERMFMQDFLDYYNTKILSEGEKFHYETFYDFYSGYLYNQENKSQIEAFYQEFVNKNLAGDDQFRDCYNRIADFNRSYNQLLASLLHKSQYSDDMNFMNHQYYDNFIKFIAVLLETYDIKVHTLNYDLFFDWLGGRHIQLWHHFSDGYQLEGSPFYGVVNYNFSGGEKNSKIYKSYHVKLEHFTNKFDTALCLFKLHGSIYNTIVYTPEPQEKIRLKNNFGISQLKMEKIDPVSGKPRFYGLHDEVAPDFLSGTTNKTRYYTKDPFYINLFEHFERNLSVSKLLIVIGYGFNDPGINSYLDKNYLSKGGKMVIIDPSKPNSDLIDRYNPSHVLKGVTELTFQQYLELVPTMGVHESP